MCLSHPDNVSCFKVTIKNIYMFKQYFKDPKLATLISAQTLKHTLKYTFKHPTVNNVQYLLTG